MPDKCADCHQEIKQKPVCPTCGQCVTQEDHPGWITVRFLGLLALLTVMLYGEATNFDETEMRVIAGVCVILGPAMFSRHKIREVLKKLL